MRHYFPDNWEILYACNLQNKRKLLCVLNIYCIFSNFPHSGIFQEPESAQPGSGAVGQSAAGQHAAPRQQGGGAGVGGVNSTVTV